MHSLKCKICPLAQKTVGHYRLILGLILRLIYQDITRRLQRDRVYTSVAYPIISCYLLDKHAYYPRSEQQGYKDAFILFTNYINMLISYKVFISLQSEDLIRAPRPSVKSEHAKPLSGEDRRAYALVSTWRYLPFMKRYTFLPSFQIFHGDSYCSLDSLPCRLLLSTEWPINYALSLSRSLLPVVFSVLPTCL